MINRSFVAAIACVVLLADASPVLARSATGAPGAAGAAGSSAAGGSSGGAGGPAVLAVVNPNDRDPPRYVHRTPARTAGKCRSQAKQDDFYGDDFNVFGQQCENDNGM